MKRERIKELILHPLTLAVVIFLVVHVFNITRFDFLAEKDSYGWLFKYEDNLRYDSVNDYRQLFSSLLISIHRLTGFSLFEVFKYLMPLMFSISFIPLWILAKKLKNKASQFLLLLTPLASSTLILQMEATRPQIMAMLFLYFSLGISMMMRDEEKRDFSFITLGSLALIGSLFHRVFAIFLLIWIITGLINYRKIVWKNRGTVVILMFLATPWLEKVEAKNMFILAYKSLQNIFDKIFTNPQFNFQFPAIYTNVDKRAMGWGNFVGVVKYYAFYAGPFFISLVVLILILCISSKKFRNYARANFKERSFLFLWFLLIFFISIAEFLPRIGNIAYLPDRAWVFLGVIMTLPLYFVLDFMENTASKRTMRDLIIIAVTILIISIFGGIYVNNSFRNIIPLYKMDSFRWIRSNIEPGSLLFSSGYNSALKYHSGMSVVSIKNDILKDKNLAELVSVLTLGNKKQFDKNLYKKNFGNVVQNSDTINDILIRDEYSYVDLIAKTRALRESANILFSQISSSVIVDTNKPAYIFFAKDSEDNPYKGRDYFTGYYSGFSQEDMQILYNHPEFFTKIYDTGEVIIWRFSPSPTRL